ncbi:MAG: hypothetical protein LBG48_01105 [Rickettsiales bacterium]|jgi:hypothetical protein|nr:hypothetical protein [Rickettsiales bacterium]
MIVIPSKYLSLNNFKSLLLKTTNFLNNDVKYKEDYYREQNGIKLEKLVFEILNNYSKNTEFESKIELISGLKFPDIIINSIFGLEIKSTISNTWSTAGNSIIEFNRVPNIENIFIIFGKLYPPIQFICKPYEECLSDIRVTHSPRYMVDMSITPTETIFSKMNITYEDFRKLEFPIEIVKDYYKSTLTNNEYIWWIDQDHTYPLKLRFFNSLKKEEQLSLRLYGLYKFHELFGDTKNKFQNFILYLLNNHSIICSNLRDLFSAGGQVTYSGKSKFFSKIPRIYDLIINNKENFINLILEQDAKNYIIDSKQDFNYLKRFIIDKWISNVLKYSIKSYSKSKELLVDILL